MVVDSTEKAGRQGDGRDERGGGRRIARLRIPPPPLAPDHSAMSAPPAGIAATAAFLSMTAIAHITGASPLVTVPLAICGLTSLGLVLHARWKAARNSTLQAERVVHSREELERLADRMWELQESEERIHGLIDALGDIVVHRDRDGRIVFANEVLTDLLGTPARSLEGRKLLDLGIEVGIVPDGAFADGECLSSTDVAIETAQGQRWFSWVELSVRDAGSGAVTHRAIAREITDRKRAETALIAARERAETANQAKSRFLATVSHEIRTPMNGIMGMAKLLADTRLSPEQRTYVGAVSTSASAMLAMIEDLLDYSKIEVGRLELEPQLVNLRELVENVVELLAPRALGKSIGLGCYVAPDIPDAIMADAGRLRQVLLNVIGNAVKFTESGGVKVEVEMAEAEAAPAIRFTIVDTGPGFRQEDVDRLFREFEQADGSTTRQHGGTGLGLAISKRIVDAMDGTITATGRSGEGSRFDIVIPAHGRVERAIDRSGTLRNRSAIIISNNRMEAEPLARTFIAHGGKARVVRMAEGTLEQLAGEAAECDVVMIDAALERGGGRLLKRLREAGICAPQAVTLIAPTDRGRLAEFKANGYKTFLVRPVRGETMLRIMLGNQAGSEIAPSSAPETGKADDIAAGRTGLKVLVAEDNQINALLAQSALEKAGHSVTLVGNGKAALDAVTMLSGVRRFDVALMDLHMPQMDGVDAISAIRKFEEQQGIAPLPIIVLSADSQETTRHHVIAHGASGFLTKPVDPATLIEAVVREAEG